MARRALVFGPSRRSPSLAGRTALTLAAAALALGSGAGAEEATGAGREAASSGGVTLPRCLGLADRNHPNLLVARAALAQVRARLLEARTAPFSQFRAFGGVALAPTVRGDSVFSPNTDASLTASLGVAWRFGIDGVLPLWTFGKITGLWDAAEANVKVSEAGVDVARDAIRYDVRKAYLGLQLARDALALLREAEEKLDAAVTKLQERVDEDDADPIDLLKLQTYVAELEARRAEAEKYERVAIAGLRFYTGVANLEPADEPLALAPHDLGDLGRYLRAARAHRPEVLMSRAGLEAREAQVRLAQAQLFPDIGLGLSMGVSAAPEVADQINPFVTDPGNYFHYGFALVFQYKLDFVPGYARIAFAEAQLQEMQALDRKALGGVAAEVEEAYHQASDWKKRYLAYQKAEGYARKWLATVQQAIDVGTMEDKDLIDPARAWAEHRYHLLDATMSYDLALAQLARVTGWDAIAPGG